MFLYIAFNNVKTSGTSGGSMLIGVPTGLVFRGGWEMLNRTRIYSPVHTPALTYQWARSSAR